MARFGSTLNASPTLACAAARFPSRTSPLALTMDEMAPSLGGQGCWNWASQSASDHERTSLLNAVSTTSLPSIVMRFTLPLELTVSKAGPSCTNATARTAENPKARDTVRILVPVLTSQKDTLPAVVMAASWRPSSEKTTLSTGSVIPVRVLSGLPERDDRWMVRSFPALASHWTLGSNARDRTRP